MFGILCVLVLATGPFIGPCLVEMILEQRDRRRLTRRVNTIGRDIDRLAVEIREVRTP